MLRGDNIVCGTSSTGTGTLTLAAPPSAIGGVDFDVLARATGIGFGNSAAVLVSYTINEYTDATFATVKQTEKGVGTLTLGSSSGISNCTLARTSKQTSATSLDSQPATQNIVPATGISVGTAANTLVFVGPSAAEVPAFSPFFTTAYFDQDGVPPLGPVGAGSALHTLIADHALWGSFVWAVPMLAKVATLAVSTVYTGGTSNAYFAIYDVGTDGRPGGLLIDFGLLGTSGSSLASTGKIASAAHATGFFLMPGDYYCAFNAGFSGGSGTPVIRTNQCLNTGRTGSNLTNANMMAKPSLTSAVTAGAWAATADLATSFGSSNDYTPGFCLKDS